jgi:hypothetical protein
VSLVTFCGKFPSQHPQDHPPTNHQANTASRGNRMKINAAVINVERELSGQRPMILVGRDWWIVGRRAGWALLKISIALADDVRVGFGDGVAGGVEPGVFKDDPFLVLHRQIRSECHDGIGHCDSAVAA